MLGLFYYLCGILKAQTYIEKLFGFDPQKTSVRTEILAGVTTFLTISYIWPSMPYPSICGKWRKIRLTMCILATLFLLKYIFILGVNGE